MLAGHEEEADAVHELQAAQRGHAHVQEHAQDDRVGDEPEHGRGGGGEAQAEEDAEVGDPLLAHPQEPPLLSGSGLLRLLCE